MLLLAVVLSRPFVQHCYTAYIVNGRGTGNKEVFHVAKTRFQTYHHLMPPKHLQPSSKDCKALILGGSHTVVEFLDQCELRDIC